MKILLFTIITLSMHSAMACIEASFENLTCTETTGTFTEVFTLDKMVYTPNLIKWVVEGEEGSATIPSKEVDSDGWETLYSCDGEKVVQTEKYLGVEAKIVTVINQGSISFSGTILSTEETCDEEFKNCTVKVAVEEYKGNCK